MIRLIKFRAWDTKKKKMWSAEEMGADELSLNPDGRGFCNPNPIGPRSTTYSGTLCMTWMIPLQFTGLCDKNGKEIYEGDILQRGRADGKHAVEYNTTLGGLYCGPFFLRKYDEQNVEVIGDIYKTPELLKVAKEKAA